MLAVSMQKAFPYAIVDKIYAFSSIYFIFLLKLYNLK